MDLAALASDVIGRHSEYELGSLTEHGEAAVDASPFVQLQKWLDEAAQLPEVIEPNAMTLATVGSDGQPSARVVLLRELSVDGLTFFTNYNSRKGEDIAANDRVAAVFFWAFMQRQVRVEGRVGRVSPQESDEYFAGRPLKSRISAVVSPQSQVIDSRAVLEQGVHQMMDVDDVQRPPYWGGYRIAAHRFEFWQGRRSRFHDRLVYTPQDEGWQIQRLAP